MAKAQEGGCLCGAVRYRVDGPLRPVTVCHCGQCRRTHGHAAAYTAAPKAALTLHRGVGPALVQIVARRPPRLLRRLRRLAVLGADGRPAGQHRRRHARRGRRPQDGRPHLRRRRRRLLLPVDDGLPSSRATTRARSTQPCDRPSPPIAVSACAARRATSSAAGCLRASRRPSPAQSDRNSARPCRAASVRRGRGPGCSGAGRGGSRPSRPAASTSGMTRLTTPRAGRPEKARVSRCPARAPRGSAP